MNMNNTKNTEPHVGEPSSPVRKFQDLNSAAKGLIEVKDSLTELMFLIGINQPPKVLVGEVNKIEEATLLSTLNMLPTEIREQINDIHEMISEIKTALD